MIVALALFSTAVGNDSIQLLTPSGFCLIKWLNEPNSCGLSCWNGRRSCSWSGNYMRADYFHRYRHHHRRCRPLCRRHSRISKFIRLICRWNESVILFSLKTNDLASSKCL